MRCKGFSLTELMVVVAVATVLMGAAYGVFAICRISWESGQAQVDLEQDVRRGMLRIVWDLQQSGSSQIQGVPADGQAYPSITLAIPSQVAADGTIVWGPAFTYALGGNGGTQLLRGATVVANHMQALTFRRQAAAPLVMEVSLTAQKTTVQRAVIQSTLASRAQLRN